MINGIKKALVLSLAFACFLSLNADSFGLVGKTTKKESKTSVQKSTKKHKKESFKNDITKKGKYSPGYVNGTVIVSASGVELHDAVIDDDLYIDKSVGSGSVHLKNVIVNGDVFICGGGSGTVTLENCDLFDVSVDKADGKVRVVATGQTKLNKLFVNSGVELTESALSEDFAGFDDVEINRDMRKNQTVKLNGEFSNVLINSNNTKIELNDGKIENLDMITSSVNTNLKTAYGTTIKNVNVVSSIKFSGDGNVENAVINNKGSLLEFSDEVDCDVINIGGKSKSSVVLLSENSVVKELNVTGSASIVGKGKVENANIGGESTDLDVLGATVISDLNIRQGADLSSVSIAHNAIVKKMKVDANAQVTGEGTIDAAYFNSECSVKVPVGYVFNEGRFQVKSLRVVGDSSEGSRGNWAVMEVEIPKDSRNPKYRVRVLLDGGYVSDFAIDFDGYTVIHSDSGYAYLNKSMLQKNRLYARVNGGIYKVSFIYKEEVPTLLP